jgi:hypothetical protein
MRKHELADDDGAHAVRSADDTDRAHDGAAPAGGGDAIRRGKVEKRVYLRGRALLMMADGVPANRIASSAARPRAGSSAPHSSGFSFRRGSPPVESGAAAELRRPDEALRTLGEHERRFPGGALAEERLAARIQSLCALGRISEAKSDLARLARACPRSAQVDRARRFCGIDAP